MNKKKKNLLELHYVSHLFKDYHLFELLGIRVVLVDTECKCNQSHDYNGKRYHYLCEMTDFILDCN